MNYTNIPVSLLFAYEEAQTEHSSDSGHLWVQKSLQHKQYLKSDLYLHESLYFLFLFLFLFKITFATQKKRYDLTIKILKTLADFLRLFCCCCSLILSDARIISYEPIHFSSQQKIALKLDV